MARHWKWSFGCRLSSQRTSRLNLNKLFPQLFTPFLVQFSIPVTKWRMARKETNVHSDKQNGEKYNTNWLNTRNVVFWGGFFSFFFCIKICIHQEPNSGQRPTLSPWIQSDEKLVFVWPCIVTHCNKAKKKKKKKKALCQPSPQQLGYMRSL